MDFLEHPLQSLEFGREIEWKKLKDVDVNRINGAYPFVSIKNKFGVSYQNLVLFFYTSLYSICFQN